MLVSGAYSFVQPFVLKSTVCSFYVMGRQASGTSTSLSHSFKSKASFSYELRLYINVFDTPAYCKCPIKSPKGLFTLFWLTLLTYPK